MERYFLLFSGSRPPRPRLSPIQTSQLYGEQERDKSTPAWELGSSQVVMSTLFLLMEKDVTLSRLEDLQVFG